MPKLPLIIKVPCYLLTVVLGVIILVYAEDFLLPVITAGLLSLMLFPFFKRLTDWKVPTLLAVIITMLLVVAILLVAGLLISKEISHVAADITSVSGKIADKIGDLQNYVTANLHLDATTLAGWLNRFKDKIIGFGEGLASGAISTTTNFIGSLMLVVIYVFCFLLYHRSFSEFAYVFIRQERQYEANQIIKNVQKLVHNYLIGLMTVIFIIGTLNSIGLTILRVPHAVFFAFFAAMLTVIPYIGISIGATLPFIYCLLTKDSPWTAFGVLAIMFTVQFTESNFITPNIVGSKVSLNPFVAIAALIIGGELWGIPGMILAVPITAIIKVLFDTRPETRPFSYFLGSEFTAKRRKAPKSLNKEQHIPPGAG